MECSVGVLHTDEQQSVCKERLQAKLAWIQREFAIDTSRTWNFDETSVCMEPRPDSRWAHKGQAVEKTLVSSSSREQVTVSLLVCAGSDEVLSQIIFAGKSDKVHPRGPMPANVQIAHSETHWSTSSTLTALLEQLESHLMVRDGKVLPYALLLDCAPMHVASAWVESTKVQHPCCKLIYIQRHSTWYQQPCDIGFFRTGHILGENRHFWASDAPKCFVFQNFSSPPNLGGK